MCDLSPPHNAGRLQLVALVENRKWNEAATAFCELFLQIGYVG